MLISQKLQDPLIVVGILYIYQLNFVTGQNFIHLIPKQIYQTVDKWSWTVS